MEETLFYTQMPSGDKIYKRGAIVAALAAAGINITSASLAMSDGEYGGGRTGYTVCYKFQWRSHGNYIWSNSVISGGKNLLETLYKIYIEVKETRDLLEDPQVRGKYRYLEEE